MSRLASATLAALASAALAVLGASGCDAPSDEPATSEEQDLVGGKAESRFQAVGYLAAAGSDEPLCGATLIASNVAVTAAHCVHRHRDQVLELGVGEIAERRRTRVRSVHAHPEAHLEKEGTVDLVHTLLLFDLAYVILDAPVEGVVPASLATTRPRHGDAVQLVGYGPLDDETLQRKGVRGRVVLNANLAGDTIVEIAPRDGGAVCHRHGDEGHAAVVADANGDPVLVGVYVGSVTQALTDCRKHLQLLNGYEATFGHLSFYEDGIEAGRLALAGEPPACDPDRICAQALSCIDGQQYPTVCGPANCDAPLGPCSEG